VIMASCRPYAERARWPTKTGYDMVAQAFLGSCIMPRAGGSADVCGHWDRGRGDRLHTFCGAGLRPLYREKTGVGQYIDIAMIDALYHMHDFGLQSHSLSGGEFVPQRMGKYHNQICPCGIYKAPQGGFSSWSWIGSGLVW